MSNYQMTPHAYGGKPLFPDNGTQAPMAGGGMAYKPNPMRGPKRENQCVDFTLKGLPCTAPRAKQTDLCIGHLKRKLKQEKADGAIDS